MSRVGLPEPGFAEMAFGSPVLTDADRGTLLKLKSIIARELGTDYTRPESGTLTVAATTVNSGFRLEWAPVPGAERYFVYRGTTTTFSASTLVATVEEQLEPGMRAYTDVTDQFAVGSFPNLYYWVRASDDVDEGPISAMATVTNTGMTTTSLQTSTSNPKVVITSANGIQIYDDAGNVVAQFYNNTLTLDGNNATLTVSGGTITGSIFKTAASGQRVEIDSSNGVRIYDSGGSLTAQFNGTTLTITGGSISGGTITGTTFATAGAGNNRVTIDSTNGLQLINSSDVTLVQLKASVFAGVLTAGIQQIDGGADMGIYAASNFPRILFQNSTALFLNGTASDTGGYFDGSGGSGAGNQPTDFVLYFKGSGGSRTARRVNCQQGTGPGAGYLYIS